MKNGDKQYIGTKWLSLAVVLGVALGTVIGKLMGNMRTGLMIGLMLAVCVWTVLTRSREKTAPPPEKENPPEEGSEASEKDSADR